MFERA
ncbi:hypothetical protein A2U01_0106530, partial [Trifolium medium]